VKLHGRLLNVTLRHPNELCARIDRFNPQPALGENARQLAGATSHFYDVAVRAEPRDFASGFDKFRRVPSATALIVLRDTIKNQPELVAHPPSLNRPGPDLSEAPSAAATRGTFPNARPTEQLAPSRSMANN
jgi:hypothetical protein